MLQQRSILDVADNTGAKKVMMIGVPGRGNKLFAFVGDIITVTVKEAAPYAQVKEGEILQAVIVRTKKESRRKDGSYLRFDDNAAVLIEKEKKEPIASRIFGPVARELKEKGFSKIVSLAAEVL